MGNQAGKTKDIGFQFGIRKNGLKIWLGNLKSELEMKKEFENQKLGKYVNCSN